MFKTNDVLQYSNEKNELKMSIAGLRTIYIPVYNSL